jgi:ATP-dependent Clp protease ATP-binding subunit ClpC
MADLSTSSLIAFRLSANEAEVLQCKEIDNEHLFLGLCKLEDLLHLEKNPLSDIDESQWQQALQDIREFRESLTLANFDPKKARRRLRKILQELEPGTEKFSGHRTQRCRDLFTFAEKICKHTSAVDILPQHLWAALLGQSSEPLDLLFKELSVERSDLLEVMKVSSPVNDDAHETIVRDTLKDAVNGEEEKKVPPKKTHTPLLEKFGKDMTKLARDGKIEPAIGREGEIKKIAQILLQKNKNNPILIGEAGVGKTAVVEGFAMKVVEESAHRQIRNFKVIELNMGSLVAGTKYRGEFEERLDGLIKEASSDPNIVLFIDEIHTMVGAGAGGGAMDAGNILKPALARGAIKCIGATTTAEYRKYIEKDPALERRFQVIWIDEPTKEQAVQILTGLRKKFEEHHGVNISDEVIEKIVELSMRYLPDFRLPDKAIDILDQACARVMLKTFSPGSAAEKMSEKVTVEDIARVVSERCRIPVESLTIEDKDRMLKIDDHLKQRVIGQARAVMEVGKTIRSAKAGLKDPNKPIVFLFVGSTGTGKTELAKALAEFLFHDERQLITFDMSEYQEKQSVAKLIGSPPGYIGHDEEGQLTGKMRSNPYSVILFDEIEKAYPEVFDIFLQIFDEGRLTDAKGRRVNFSESVVILTSNLGSSIGKNRGEKRPMGFNIDQAPSDEQKFALELNPEDASKKWIEYEVQIQKAIGGAFRPEFLNRVQKMITFYPLSRETVKQIISGKILPALNRRLNTKGIQVFLSDEALNFLMSSGYNEALGAREMQRVFDQHISEPLSQMILKGEAVSGQTVRATVSGNMIRFIVD